MSDNAFLRLDGLKAALSRVKTKVDSDIASAISESTISLTSLISSGDSSTLINAKSYIDGIKTNLDNVIASNLATAKGYTDGAKTALETNITNHKNDTSNPHNVTAAQVGAAASSHTHTESDITDLGNYANASHTHTEIDITDLGDYATNTNLNTYGVKSLSFDNSTGILTLTMKDDSTKTVTIQVSGSGSGSSSGSSITISSVSYDDTTNNIIFTMSDNSTVNCSLNDLLDQVLTFEECLKTFEYNSDWEDQMTGTGTEEDPYLIYTPKDFMSINNDMDGHYKLMNNLDFSELTGLSIQLDETNNTFTLTTTDNSAELYNSGEGYRPIGYDGYYPLNGSTKSTSVFSELSNIGSIPVIYGSSTTSQYYVFTGELDGNSKIIKGIISSPANAYSVGLFSFLGNGAKIHNLTIKDSAFIVNDVYAGYADSYNLMSGVGSVTGNITYIDDNSNNRVNIYNVYSYATLISNRTASSGSVSLGGIYAKIQGDSYPGCLVNQCAFRGKFMILNPQNHRVRGIGSYSNYGDSTNRITNCINTATLKNGSYTEGIGQNLGKVNINCGLLEKYGGEAYSLSGHANTSYVNGKQFSIRDNLQYDTRTSESTNNSFNYYFKTAAEIKSRDFITEANNLSGSKVFIYNNLGIDNNWPLLVDEYKQYIDYDLDLDLAIVDKTNNKVYSSGLTINDISTVGHSHTANDITDASSTFAAKSHTHTTSEITNFGNYANASHTHTESDITNLGNYATNTDLNSYGVKSISYTSNILTLTMKDNSTKTVTIQASGESGSSGSENTSIGVNISSATYNTDYKSIEFIMSDNSIINCSLIELIKSIINNDENLTIAPLIYNSEWVDRITGTGTEEDPYLIYTPKDFMSINNDMDGHYKLMNNLDFSNLCGLSVETDDENNSFTITTEDSSAVMYNNGEGYFPIGYDGYYPLNGTEKSTSLFSELANINNTSKIYGTSATSQYYCFTGELDGNSKVISGIISNPANTYSIGLFSFLANKAYIHNLTIKDSVFILNDIYCTSNKNSGIGSVTGCITYIDNNTNNRVNISNVYSYSTLISNKSTSGYCSIAGIYSRVTSNNNNGDTAPGCLVNQCTFRGKMMIINPTVSHHVVGIGHYAHWYDSVNRITNCINTATLKNGLNYTQGIGQNLGKVNINCGLLEKYGGEAYSLSGHANTDYVNGKQFTIKDNLQFDTRNSESTNNYNNYYFKTIAEIKSQTFINEANNLSDAPVFIVNDLNFDNGWPLLIDEYNQLEKYTNKKTSNNLNKNLVYDSNLTNITIDYNSEWVDRITGTGTEEDPYLIYTPKDFMSINNDMDGHYKLMNNLDFSNLCGIDIQANKSAESYSVNITDDSAPLYNNGEGYFPIGYDGFYPTPYVTDDNHPNGYYTPGGDPGPITWEEINEIEQWNSSPSTSNIRGSMSSSNYLQYCFTGELDGNSKVIKGIRCKPASTFSVGLFMLLSKNASIHNLMLIDSIFVISDVWHQWPNNTNRECYIGAIAGDLCKGNISGSYTVNIYNVYSYATLINDFRSGTSYQGSFTGGLIGDNGSQTTVNFKFNQCTNRGIIIRTNKLDAHIISGIITSQNHGSSQMIMNCINSSNFTAKWAIGLGYTYFDKININFGAINTYANSTNWQTLLAVGGESERTSSTYSYYNEKTPYVKYDSSIPRYYAKSEEFLKSQEFIDEANGYNGTPLLIYNDLGVDNDWPLLIDEYNIIKKFMDSLKITAIDVNTNKVYSSTILLNNIAEKHHSHVVNDITNRDLLLAPKNHTHVLADLTDIGVINTENGIQYSDVSSTNYNNEWIDRITGTGTQADPYLIYTPKDFMKINDDMTAHYKLMNNLDFAPVIGIMIETSGNSYTSTTVDDLAPLYNNGEGYFPIGYNGYYPLNNASGEMNSTQHFDSLTNPERFAYNATTYSYNTVYKYGFFGELDGNNKIIKGITCAPADTYSVGLFHFLGNRAYIHNLTIKDSVFILKGNLAPNGGYSSIGTLAGFVIRDKNSNTFTINDVYTYATLINHETKLGSSSYSYTNGLCGRVVTNSGINYSINRCANHSTFVLITPNVTHVTCGIFLYESDMNGKITNCINTSSFSGYNAHGIGNVAGKVNINCGTITGSNETRPIVKTKNISYTDGKQFVNRSMESYDFYTNETQANQYNIYYKTTAELKSQEFIDEVNALLPEPVFAYNDLNINDGWPLLINEYNSIVGVDGNLNVSLVDPINNKIYKSGYSLERLQKLVTYREATSFLNGQFDSSFNTRLSTLKCVSLTIETSEWTAEEDNGTATGNYLATKTITGITATSPVQMISQLGSEIQINAISTDSVTFIATSQPDSNINISIMFT